MLRTLLLTLALAGSAFAQDAQLVEVAPVRSESVDITRPMVASLEAVMRTSVAAEMDGRVASRSFDDGQLVKAKTELVTLDTELMQADLAAAEAMVAAAEAELNRAQVERRRSEREYNRQKDLFEKNVSPEKELLDAQSAYELAEADVKTKDASIVQRKAVRDRIATEIRKSKVFAPFDGYIARRHVEVGQWVKQGDVVADLVQLDPLYVVVSVPEAMAGQLRVGDVGSVSFDSMPGTSLDVPVKQIMPEADMASRLVRVRLELGNKDGALRPGFLGRVIFRRATGESLVVPKNAIVTGAQGSHVVVANNNVAAIVPVKLLKSTATDAIIQAELKPGDLVVTRGNEALYPGAAVNFAPPATQPADANAAGGRQP